MAAASCDLESTSLGALSRNSLREGPIWLKAKKREPERPSPSEMKLKLLSQSFHGVVCFD